MSRMQRWMAGAAALAGRLGLVLAGCGSSQPHSSTSASAPPHSAGAPHTTGCAGSQLTLSYAGHRGRDGTPGAARGGAQQLPVPMPVARLPGRPAARWRGPAPAAARGPPRRLLSRHRVRTAGGGAQAGRERPLRDQPGDQQRVQGRAGLPHGGGRHALGARIAARTGSASRCARGRASPRAATSSSSPPCTRRSPTAVSGGQAERRGAAGARLRACSPARPAHGA